MRSAKPNVTANFMTKHRNMILRLLFLSFLVWTPFLENVQGQNIKNKFKADSIFVYRNFNQCGTTANLRHNHRYLDSLKFEKKKFDLEDLNKLNDMLKFSKMKKLFQQKYGGEICYLIIYQNGIRRRFVTYISKDYCLLDDIDSMRRWKTKSPKEAELFFELINKNWR